MEIAELILAVVLVLTVVLVFCMYAISTIQHNQLEARKFEIQMMAASTTKSQHILNMPYKDLIGIVDTNMMYYIEQEVIASGIYTLDSDEQISLKFDTLLVSICANVDASLSNSLKEALLFYISENHLKTYIKNTTRILLTAKIEQAKHKKHSNK